MVGGWFNATEEGYRAVDSLHEALQIFGDLLKFRGLSVRCSALGGWEGEGGRVISYIFNNSFLIDGVNDGSRLVRKGLIGTNNIGGRLRDDGEWEQESWNDEVVK